LLALTAILETIADLCTGLPSLDSPVDLSTQETKAEFTVFPEAIDYSPFQPETLWQAYSAYALIPAQ
jgi:hypothetical protein